MNIGLLSLYNAGLIDENRRLKKEIQVLEQSNEAYKLRAQHFEELFISREPLEVTKAREVIEKYERSKTSS